MPSNGSLASTFVDAGRVLLRDHLGEGLPVRFIQRSLDVGRDSDGHIFSGGMNTVAYPNGPGNGLLMHPVWVHQHRENGCIRGRLRGLYHILHKQTLGHMSTIDGVTGLPGRKALLLDTYVKDLRIRGSVAIDITGPWS